MSERETMTTPNFTPDVPQWNEPMRYEIPYSNGCAGCPRLFIGTRWIGEVCGAIYLGHDSEKYAARIVSLWNEAIATPAPAASDAGGVRYACSKLAALGDTVKFLRIDDGLRLKVVKVRDDGMCELEYFDGGFFGTVYANQLEFVPEIPPATTPKYDGLPEFPTPAQRIDDALPYFREWLTNPEGTDGCYMECLHSGEIVAHFSDMNDALAFQAMAAAYEKAIGLLERVESPPDMNWFKELWSLTGEHMVLTEEGWIPAECNTREHTGSDPADVLDEVNKPIETDAAGNALSNSPETDEQRASRILGDPMRRVEMNTRDETPAHPVCRGCNQPLKAENAWISDGCPCNNPRGINHGLVPKECCTCDECSPQQQQASGVERWDIRSVITLGDEPPYVIEKYRNGQFVKAADHDAAIAAKCAEIESLKHSFKFISHSLEERNKDALAKDAEIKRLENALDENWTTHQQIINARTVRNGEYDKLHAMLVAEQQEHGRTGVELNEYAESCKHWRERAEAAEAKCLRLVGEAIARAEKADEKCAEYRDTFDATNNMRLNEVRLRHQIQKRADDLTAQLAAANERLVSVDNSPYVRCLEGDGKPYVLRVGMSMRNWDGSQSNHPHWHIQRLTWSEYGGPFSSPEKANEYLGGMLERNPNYYTTIAGIAALAKPSAEVVE